MGIGRKHGRNLSAEQAHQVDQVSRLLEDLASSKAPVPDPGNWRNRCVPPGGEQGQGGVAEHLLGHLGGGVVTPLVSDRAHDVAPLDRGGGGHRTTDRGGERLLDEDVDTSFGGEDHLLGVISRWRAEVDGVGSDVFQQLPVIVRRSGTGPAGHGVGRLATNIGDPDKPHVLNLGQPFEMFLSHPAGTDNHHGNRHRLPLSCASLVLRRTSHPQIPEEVDRTPE